ncbi:MAG: class I SAM-dependent methyltransferase, partial [candidate division KSB1 bacterium]|nr:class I SAM-dependent methyltransferase [candidate division KSB1 bacterium]
MKTEELAGIQDAGERMIPTKEGEISFVFSRHEFAYRYAQNFVHHKTVIDIGCGTGYGCKLLAEKAKFVIGIDYDAEAIHYCRTHYSSHNIQYIQLDASSLTMVDRQFDVAISFQVIEHLQEVNNFMTSLKEIVTPNGIIMLSTPNAKKKAKKKNPFHVHEMSYDQFRELLEAHFESFDLLGVAYARNNKLRSFLGKTPFYQWGK